MNLSRVVFWVIVFSILTMDYTDTALVAKFYYWSSKYWYGVARFAGTIGLQSEQKYHEEMESFRG